MPAAAATASTQWTLERFRTFLDDAEGSVLRAWLKHCDSDLDLRVRELQFNNALRKMSFPGDPAHMFALCDEDGTGELSLEELDCESASLWSRFREWGVSTFETSKDMVKKFEGCMKKRQTGYLDVDTWREGLVEFGWEAQSPGFNDLLFEAFDLNDERQLGPQQLRWLDIEVRRRRRKEQAKERALQTTARRTSKNQAAAKAALFSFKQHLRHVYGNYIRAWRCALSPNDLMVVQKTQFFVACADLGLSKEPSGQVKLIWRALGKDELGSLSLDELDSKSAVLLAHFQLLVEQSLGGAAAAFRVLDRNNVRKVRFPEFASVLQGLGFRHPMKALFRGLDRTGDDFLVEEDLHFLNRWKPPAFLVASPNVQATEEVKAHLLRKYGGFLKSWRRILDTDNSNRCTWTEFGHACRKIGFYGDVAGAWRALDNDMSGFITLAEIDKAPCEQLWGFRKWCDDEFGSVRSAYMVFDDDNSGSVGLREFRRACRIYGYEPGVKLFKTLDVEGNGTLGVDEVSWIDNWEFPEKEEEPDPKITKKISRNRGMGMCDTTSTQSRSSPRGSISQRAGRSPSGSPPPTGRRETRVDVDMPSVPRISEDLEQQPEQPLASTMRSLRANPMAPHSTASIRPEVDPERTWWKAELETPRLSPPPAFCGHGGKSAKSPASYCAQCKSRGPCRHMPAELRTLSDPRCTRSVTPTAWRPCDAVEGGFVAKLYPTHLDGTLRAHRKCRQRHLARLHPKRPVLPPTKVPPRVATALGCEASDTEEEELAKDAATKLPPPAGRGQTKQLAGADVQLQALRSFPMGSTTAGEIFALR